MFGSFLAAGFLLMKLKSLWQACEQNNPQGGDAEVDMHWLNANPNMYWLNAKADMHWLI
jgi:hypothetical protein